MKVSELEGAKLDYWVARAMGFENILGIPESITGTHYRYGDLDTKTWAPSTDWEQGGPIIERDRIYWREAIETQPYPGWIAWSPTLANGQCGSTQLIAAMRCFVASKFGEEVENSTCK